MEVMCSIYLAHFKNPLLATACRCGRMRRGVAVVGGEPGSFLVMRPTEGAAERGGLTFPRGVFLRVVSSCPSLPPPFAPLCSHCCPKTEIQAAPRCSTHL